jgi:hypothetical protein
MENHFKRDKDGIWWITLPDGDVKCNFSGSLEIAYQMGLKENIHQQLAEMCIKESSKSIIEAKIINDSVEGRHDEQPKPVSDFLNTTPVGELGL